jgi:serine-type D-Ala-D-Ala carboxypeptidase/endopeptidase (penicillin-binding protein 4)
MAVLVEDLVLAGVTAVRGGLVIDDSYFDGDIEPPHFDEQPGELASFRAPVSAASLNFNAVAVLVTPARSGAGAATVITDPPTDYVRLSGEVQTVRTGRTRVRVEIRYHDDTMEVLVGGQIRAGAGPHRYRYRVGHPVHYFGGTMRAMLERRGVRVGSRRIRTGEVPERAVRLASRSSPPMTVIIRGLGKYSNNFVAEVLLKTMGAEAHREEPGPATWADGLAAVQAYLVDYVGLARGAFRYGNGSGLFDSSELSPEHIVRLLAAAHRDFRYGPDLVASLAISGTDGTLRQRMAGGSAERQVRAKTGTLATVSALGGYVAVDSRHPLAFAVLVNDMPRGSAREARALQDEVAKALVRYARSAE